MGISRKFYNSKGFGKEQETPPAQINLAMLEKFSNWINLALWLPKSKLTSQVDPPLPSGTSEGFSKEILDTHYQDGSILSGHVSHKGVPGVEFSTGSLGHGLSVASGFALAAKRKSLNFKSYVLLSDGELDEGSNWEAILFAPHHNLDNLTCIVDYNKLQSLTSVKETLNLEPLKDKITSFGWNVIDIDGHNHDELKKSINKNTSKPKFIIANTIKGKGISFMENKVVWHYKSANEEELEKGLDELEE